MTDKWNDERVALIVRRRSQATPASMSEIAGELGPGFTRNAVIGKVNRLKQSGAFDDLPVLAAPDVTGQVRAEAAAPAAVERVARRSTPLTKVSDIRMRPMPVEEPALPVGPIQSTFEVNLPETDWFGPFAVNALDAQTCRWPVGDPLRSDFRFCGCSVLASGPYCATHATLAFSGSSRRASSASRAR